jgi:hypothetical protein
MARTGLICKQAFSRPKVSYHQKRGCFRIALHIKIRSNSSKGYQDGSERDRVSNYNCIQNLNSPPGSFSIPEEHSEIEAFFTCWQYKRYG